MRAVIQSVETILSTPSTETLTSQYGEKAISDAVRGSFQKFKNLIQEENSVETAAYSISNPFEGSTEPIPKTRSIKISLTLSFVYFFSPNDIPNQKIARRYTHPQIHQTQGYFDRRNVHTKKNLI